MVARRAHNPEVVGSSPASATTEDKSQDLSFFCAVLVFILKISAIRCSHWVCVYGILKSLSVDNLTILSGLPR